MHENRGFNPQNHIKDTPVTPTFLEVGGTVGAREKPEWLRALAALPDSLHSVDGS